MKVLAILTGLLVLGCVSVRGANGVKEEWHEAKIGGFAVGDYSVKGAIERQLDEAVITPILGMRIPDRRITFVVIGGTDKTGTSGRNADIGLRRAEGVRTFLLLALPGANINVMTKSDEVGERAVIVKWQIAASPASARATARHDATDALLSMWGIYLIVTVVMGFFLARALRKPKSKAAQWRSVSVVWNGERYSVPVEVKGGKYGPPFADTRDPNSLMCLEDWETAKKQVKNLFKHPETYGPAIKKLIADGTIKKERQ